MRNKHYKEENHGGYAINVGAFDIIGSLGKSRIIEDGNESLQTVGLNRDFQDDDGYMDITVKEGKTPYHRWNRGLHIYDGDASTS